MSECFFGHRKNVPKFSTPVHARVFVLMSEPVSEEMFAGISASYIPFLWGLICVPQATDSVDHTAWQMLDPI
jgi:hypothetical protein